MRRLLTLACLSLITSLAAFAANAEELSDNYGRAEFITIPDGDSDGVSAFGSAAINRHFRLFGSYTHSTLDTSFLDVDVDQITAGVGYIYNFSNDLKVHVDLGAVHTRVTSDFGDVSDQGGIAAVSLRWAPMAKLEVEPNVSYAWIDGNNSTTYGVRASYWVNHLVALGASVFDSDDSDVGFGVHIRFGPQRSNR